MKTINEWSFVNFYNVKASTGKQKTHSIHNVGWFYPELTLTITSGGELRGHHSCLGRNHPMSVFQVCEQSLQKTWKSSMQTSAPHRWQLAREPRFVLFWWWSGSKALSGLKVHVLNKMLWPFATSAHTIRCMPFLAPISFLWRRRRHAFSCLFLNENHELRRSNSRQIDLCRQWLHSCDLLPCWLRSKVAGVAYSEPTCTNFFCPNWSRLP